MAVTARAVFQAHVDGLSAGDFPLKLSWILAAAAGSRLEGQSILTAGTLLAPPSTTTLVVVVPPTNNTNAITLKGNVGDTGVALNVNKPTILAIANSGSYLLYASGSNITGCTFAYL